MRVSALKKALAFVLLGALMLPATTVGAFAAEPDAAAPAPRGVGIEAQLANDREPNVLLIKFKDAAQVPGQEKQLLHEIAKVEKTGFVKALGVYIVRLDELEKDPSSVLNRFKNNVFVEYAEPNYLGELDLAPTDPDYEAIGTMYSEIINAEAGWDIITGSSVTVALVDSGYSGNSDLPAASGYSILQSNTDLTDTYGHGTQVAGTLGALGDNGNQNVGVVWKANLLPVKITESASVTVANVASAIIYAADSGARVINLSLSFPADSTTLQGAVDYAYKKGCVLVAAAGNKSKATVNYPAAYGNVLGVGGTADGTSRYSASNYGTGLDVLAGYTWYTTAVSGKNTLASGTSISAPQAAGLAALIWALAPGLTNAQVMDLIRDNTNRAGGTWDNQTGYGTIDMGKALAAAQALGRPATNRAQAFAPHA